MSSSNDIKQILAANPPRITVTGAGQVQEPSSAQSVSSLEKNKAGRKPKHLTFTRDRICSEGDIRELFKRKRETSKEVDSAEPDSDFDVQPLKRWSIIKKV